MVISNDIIFSTDNINTTNRNSFENENRTKKLGGHIFDHVIILFLIQTLKSTNVAKIKKKNTF